MEINVQQILRGQWIVVVMKMSNNFSNEAIFMTKHVLICVGVEFFWKKNKKIFATPFFWGVVELRSSKRLQTNAILFI